MPIPLRPADPREASPGEAQHRDDRVPDAEAVHAPAGWRRRRRPPGAARASQQALKPLRPGRDEPGPDTRSNSG
jgi:hypothetical protein